MKTLCRISGTNEYLHKIRLQENSIRDARTPQPGDIVFNTMKYRSCEKVQRSGYFQSSVSYIIYNLYKAPNNV